MIKQEKENVESLPIRDQVADIIRQMIINGELKAGQKISERQISKMLNISTTPVKEAFRALQTEKLIVCVPRKGSFISEHSRENLKEVTYIRSAIDGVSAYFAAIYATENQKRMMRELLEQARAIIEERGDAEELSNINERFHSVLRESSNNTYLCNMANSFLQIDSSMRKVVNVTDYEQLLNRQLQHEEILKAVETGDSAEAERRMVHHIRDTSKHLFWVE